MCQNYVLVKPHWKLNWWKYEWKEPYVKNIFVLHKLQLTLQQETAEVSNIFCNEQDEI